MRDALFIGDVRRGGGARKGQRQQRKEALPRIERSPIAANTASACVGEVEGRRREREGLHKNVLRQVRQGHLLGEREGREKRESGVNCAKRERESGSASHGVVRF